MEKEIDYSRYTLEELISAREHIDEDEYPERVKQLDELISQRARESSKRLKAGRKVPVVFHGDGREFFSIWIVNLLLTILTLGIYSAWAKVRTNRYFYSNTEIDGHRFSYLADPVNILKGRIIAVVLFAIYYLSFSFAPAVAGFMLIGLFFLAPFLIIMSLKFSMKVTSYRNIRFGFKGQYGDAFVTFILLPILSVFTLYLLLPWVWKKMDEFIVSNTTFGNKPFTTELNTGDYYMASIITGVIGFVVVMVFGIFIGVSAVAVGSVGAETGTEPGIGEMLLMLAMMAVYMSAFFVASSFYNAFIRNHIYNSSQLEDVANFDSDVKVSSLVYLRVTNLLLLACTLGFAIPWVKVRTARFYADATKVNMLAGAGEVLEDPEQSPGALGDEVADAFDIDIALG